MEEITDKITDKRLENLAPPFEKGKSGNPNGRPKGRRNFSTIFYDALEKLAEKNGMEPDQLETEIVEKALLTARKGDHRFYKDLMDRLHGTPVHRTQMEDGEGNTVQQVLVKIIRDGDKGDSN